MCSSDLAGTTWGYYKNIKPPKLIHNPDTNDNNNYYGSGDYWLSGFFQNQPIDFSAPLDENGNPEEGWPTNITSLFEPYITKLGSTLLSDGTYVAKRLLRYQHGLWTFYKNITKDENNVQQPDYLDLSIFNVDTSTEQINYGSNTSSTVSLLNTSQIGRAHV